MQSAGLGVASLRDLASAVDVVVIPVPAEVIEKVGSPYVAATIPAKTYTGQDADVPTAASSTIWSRGRASATTSPMP